MAQHDLYAVILAGGTGTRFWPFSREKKPKQFLKIIGDHSLLQDTLKRVQTKIPPKNTYIVTSRKYKKSLAQQVKGFAIPSANILFEPEGKNTAPAIAWAASLIYKKNKKAILTVLPSDHLILDQARFWEVLNAAIALARDHFLVTLGIVPTRPETGYGYLQCQLKKHQGKSFLSVERFTEKPSLTKAQQFIRKKNYFWNSGMFVWKASVILEECKHHVPAISKVLSKGTSTVSIKKHWRKMPNISIDYGVLEKADRVAAVPASDIGWSDLGSWESLIDVLPKNEKNNIIKGNVIHFECDNSLIWGHKHVIAAVGCQDLIIVDTPDALLVCQKDFSQLVKNVVTTLKAKKRREV